MAETRPAAPAESVSNDTVFAQRFEYHRHLVGRRWQLFAAYLIMSGLLFNVVSASADFSREFELAFFCANISVSLVFIRLIVRLRRRIRDNAAALNQMAGRHILDVGRVGSFAFEGETLWLVAAATALTAVWLIALFRVNWMAAAAATAIFILGVVVIDLRHRRTKEP